MKRFAVAVLSIALAAPAVFASNVIDKGAITPTLYAVKFEQIESELIAAHAAKDTAVLDKLLSPWFEVRKYTGEIVTKADWLKRAPVKGVVPSHMAVYEVGPNAVAQFLQKKPGETSGMSIVDVWMFDSGVWRLRVRFESPLP